MRTRLLSAALAGIAVAASTPAHAADAGTDHAWVRVDGTVRTGCGAICAAGESSGNVTFGGTITTVEAGDVVSYGFNADITLDEQCDTGSAYGTLYFGSNAWPFAWTHTHSLLVMTANDQAAANFAGAGTHVFLPDPVVSDDSVTSCTSWAVVDALLLRFPRPGPV